MFQSTRWFLTAVLAATFSIAHAQNFGGFPPSTKWQQINTDTARILFSPAAKAEAMRVAQLVHAAAKDTPVAIGRPLKKINIVLHNQSTEANGYVALGPFRSEYYLIPGADLFEFGNLPWHENLAVHEYRHVQQYNAFNNGLTKIFSFFGGQNGRALANALTVPDWFFEGDAVYAETAFTGLGRGRQPLFLSAYNSLWQEGKAYSWMKLRNGSYRDYVPNHYPLGYLLVNYGYLKYGPRFWQQVTTDASAFKGFFYPFQKAVARYAHEDFKKFRTDALAFYKREVEKEPVVTNDKTVTNYYFPQPVGKDSLLYLKESYRQLPAFYIRDSRGDHYLKLRNISTENWFHYAAGKLVYTAYNTNKRWSLINYSDIVLLDIHTKKETQLTRNGKYFTPVLSPDGQQVVAVFINDSLQTELHILNAQTGAVIKKITSYTGDYFMQPKFIDDQNIVLSIRSADGLLSLQRMNIVNGNSEELIAPQQRAIGEPYVFQNTIYFTASFSGNDELYAFRLNEKKAYQLASGQTGNYNVGVYNDSLVWSKFTTKGRQLQQQPLNAFLWKEIKIETLKPAAALYPVASSPVNLRNSNARNFDVKKYSKATGLINIHSWDPSLTFYSNNILNTLAASAYYQYNEAEKSHTTGFRATYGGFFPVLSARIENTFNRHIKRPDSTLTANSSERSIGYNIPLNFTRGKTAKALNFGTSYVNATFRPTGASKNSAQENNSSYLHHFVSWAQQLQQARQQIFPRLGYAAALHYRHRLDEPDYQWLGGAAVYLPTFSKTHALVLTASFQQVDTSNVLFSNRFSLARGYPDYYYSRMWTAGVNYHMPLLYPDWGFANVFYLLRVRSAFYFDYSQVFSKNRQRTAALRSTGVELYFDTRWWNQLPVSFGVRYSYLLDKQFASSRRHVFGVVLPVDLLPF